tara:strand:+ start:2120 stop:2752 length:633 start_codon:yes stop_codon:yes gene_type:complete
MNNKTNIIVGVVATIALILGFVAYNKTPSTIVGSAGQQGPKGEQGPAGRDGVDGKDGARGPAGYSAPASPVLGALSGPDLPYPYLSVGGVREWASKVDMTTAVSSTTCSILSPVATSTIMYAGASLSTIASTTVFEIGYDATSPNATTSLLVTKNLTLGTQDTISASTTNQIILSPNTRVNYKVGGGSVAGTVSQKFVGSCTAGFRQLSY